jgi:hypothetical protein
MNYGANEGTWMVWDPTTGQGGDGAMVLTSKPNGGSRVADFVDGLSNTVGFAEVRAHGAYLLGGSPTATPPATAADQLALGGTLKNDSAHTGWTEGQTFQTGVTFALPPSTVVNFTSGGTTTEVDYISSRDGSSATNISYASAISRSYHTGGIVNVLLMDGSTRTVPSSVSVQAWRAAGTRSGRETLTLD